MIQLNKIVPMPLRDKLLQRRSDIWNNTLTFTVGEWVKIKAPSGTGKTTFIHSLYSIRTDYDGNISWNNKDLKNYNTTELATLRQQEVSIVFQDLRLFPQLTAKENIEINRVLQDPYCKEEVIDTMAELLGITHIMHQKAGICSYGEQQRIAIIRALVQPFKWLLMDEPFSHLDEANTLKAAMLIAEECTKRNAGFILTDLEDDTHFEYGRKMSL